MTAEQREDYEERAAILEFDAGMSRTEAEREAIAGLLPWVVTQVIACNGLKCRALVCESCSCDAEENAQKACDSYSLANEALADTASEDQAK